MEENKRVLLGMSGGTDSSVAAMRLLEAGYEVTGVTFRFYELNDSTEYLKMPAIWQSVWESVISRMMPARYSANRSSSILCMNIWWGILLCPAHCAITI